MKVITVVGARPQFIKLAMISSVLRKEHKEVIVHTGQHYDDDMSEIFFTQMGIPKPDYNLGISGGSHGQMTGRMMISLEEIYNKEVPDIVIVYGDTNSTLAAAISAAKLRIPIVHIEAGVRTHCRSNPEEINRICTDHISSRLLACTLEDMDNLQKEGLTSLSYLVGDPMYDAFLKYSDSCRTQDIMLNTSYGSYTPEREKYYLLTCHREENSTDEKLKEILATMEMLDFEVIFPVHPRNKDRINRLKQKYAYKNIVFCEPVGYKESIWLITFANKIITDSGGVQREAFFAEKQCITLLDFVTWKATMVNNRNQLARIDRSDILSKLSKIQKIDVSYKPFGDGHASERILSVIDELEKEISNNDKIGT